MSIRLRLTFLYSAILALTLIAFSATLYFAQSRFTFDAIKATLMRQAEGYANLERRFPRRPDERRPDEAPTFTPTLPGRWTQTRNPDGTLAARSADLSDTALPLGDAGLKIVQGGAVWFETTRLDDEPLLIYSQPIFVQERFVRIVQVAASMQEREQSLGTLRAILAIGSGLAILAAFAIGWALAGMALAPIHRITHTAQAIGAERDFSRRVQHAGPNDEIGQLAITFNAMLTELESAFRQIEQSLQTQRRFVADASHELRTPLTTIRGNIELLRRDPPLDAQERAEILIDTKDETERLIRLVNQLLVLARADAGHTLRRESVALAPLIEDVCRQCKSLAPDRAIQIDVVRDASVIGDRDALKQVLLILVDNALAHTPAHAAIALTSASTDTRVSIAVRDTGPGIALEILPHIFERFFRADLSRSRGGAGLGLSIAKELIEAQGGTLNVASQIGNGSTFTVALPRG
ncbi:MAG: HAMP domain-containing histidine kinase [Chloroflexi bacterium]|nr:HAMP domain-containing histidine kinase [Chloroflexota bacterium]